MKERLIDALIALILPVLFLVSCEGPEQDNKQGTTTVGQQESTK